MPTMRNPNLPPDQTVTVPDETVPHLERSGWQVTDTPAEGGSPAEPDTTDQAAGSDSEQEI